MNNLFPRDLYLTGRGQAMNRFVAFLTPASLIFRKIDDFAALWRTTHDRRSVPMVVADETCEPLFGGELFPAQPRSGSGGGGWHGPVLRNYWDGAQPMLQSLSSSSLLSGPGDHGRGQAPLLGYLPLGCRFEFPPVDQAKEVLPSHERRYLVNMMASLDTHPNRGLLHDRLVSLQQTAQEAQQAQQDRAAGGGGGGRSGRGAAAAAAAAAATEALPTEVFVHNTKVWASALPTTLAKGGAVPTATYRAVLLGSVFTLCPSGHNPETFRIFEACEAGSIPIVDYVPSAGGCVDPWRPFLDSGAPFVWVRDWGRVEDLLAALAADPARVAATQRAVRVWYRDAMTRAMATVEDAARAHLADWLVHRQESRWRAGGAAAAAAAVAEEGEEGRVAPPPALAALVRAQAQCKKDKKAAVAGGEACPTMAAFLDQQDVLRARWQKGPATAAAKGSAPLDVAQAVEDKRRFAARHSKGARCSEHR